MLKVLASEAPELYLLAEMIARYTNAHCHMDLRDMAEAERKAEVETLKAWFEELSA
jgi:DNA-binding transcriptional regulator YbjK